MRGLEADWGKVFENLNLHKKNGLSYVALVNANRTLNGNFKILRSTFHTKQKETNLDALKTWICLNTIHGNVHNLHSLTLVYMYTQLKHIVSLKAFILYQTKQWQNSWRNQSPTCCLYQTTQSPRARNQNCREIANASPSIHSRTPVVLVIITKKKNNMFFDRRNIQLPLRMSCNILLIKLTNRLPRKKYQRNDNISIDLRENWSKPKFDPILKVPRLQLRRAGQLPVIKFSNLRLKFILSRRPFVCSLFNCPHLWIARWTNDSALEVQHTYACLNYLTFSLHAECNTCEKE
jgi:hypothetical protein